MVDSLTLLLLKLDDKMQQSLKTHLKQQVFIENWLWCRVVYFLYSEILVDSIEDIYKEFSKGAITEETKLGFLHIVQEFANYINYQDVYGRFGCLENIIVSRCLLQHATEVDVQVAEDFSRIRTLEPQKEFSNR